MDADSKNVIYFYHEEHEELEDITVLTLCAIFLWFPRRASLPLS